MNRRRTRSSTSGSQSSIESQFDLDTEEALIQSLNYESEEEVVVRPPAKKTRARKKSSSSSSSSYSSSSSSSSSSVAVFPSVHLPPARSSSLTAFFKNRETCSAKPNVQKENQIENLLIQKYCERFSKLCVSSSAKLGERIQCFEFHPKSPLIYAGGKTGSVSIWNFAPSSSDMEKDEELPPTSLNIHRGRVTDVKVHPFVDHSLLSSSYDGDVCLIDIGRAQSSILFSSQLVDDNGQITSMDVANDRCTVLIGSDSGQAFLKDLRQPHSQFLSFALHPRKISCVAIHPRDSNFFCSSSNSGPTFSVWDLRKIQSHNEPEPLHTTAYDRVVKSMCFSSSGSRLLTSSYDSKVRIYSSLNNLEEPTATITHQGGFQTGIWISDFRPNFHPVYDDLYVSGEIGTHSIPVYSCRQKRRCYSFSDRSLKAVTSLAKFHPMTETLLTCSYGNVYVWSDEI